MKQDIPADLIAAFGTDYGYFLGTTDVPKLVFYRKSRFSLATVSDAQGVIDIPNVYTEASNPDCWSLSKNRTLGYTKLQDINSGRNYFVAAMHPVNNPNCWMGRDENRKVLKPPSRRRQSGCRSSRWAT